MYIHANIVFQISQELRIISKIVARFTKVYSEIRFSENSYHTETSQSTFSNFRSIIDLQKNNHIDFKQNQVSILFSGLGPGLNFFFRYESAGFSVLVNISVKKN